MKKQSLFIFAAVTLILLATAAYISQQQAPQTSIESAPLLPELKDKVNTIDNIRIESADGELNLNKPEDIWVIEQADNYPALFDKVKQTVVAVAEFELLSEKTSNPELYNRLGVEDITTRNARSHLLKLTAAGKPVVSLIVGNTRRSKSPSDQPGLYVRLPDSKQALLVAGNLAITTKLTDWFDQNVLDINSSEVQHINIEPAGQSAIELTRSSEGGDLVLQTIPEGKESQADAIISQTGTILEGVFAESVKRDVNLQDASKVATFTVTTFKGLKVHGQLVQQAEKYYTLFSVTAEPTAESEEASEAEANELAIIEQAEQLEQRVAGWGYVLPQHKIDIFTKTLDDLTRDKGTSE